ncbi:MAG: GNAT family N-acetyltransferase [bacterium]
MQIPETEKMHVAPSESQKAWDVRPYQPGDEHQIVRLFNAIFDKKITAEHWLWKFKGQPGPVENIWLATVGEQIIAQYAGTPMRFKLAGEEHQILHVADVMTATKFRRQGVLTALGRRAHQAWAAAGVPFVTGLHYGGWGSRRQYLGWKEQFRALWVRRVLRPERLLTHRLTLPQLALWGIAGAARIWNTLSDTLLQKPTQGIEVCPVDKPGPEFDELWASVKSRYEALIVRDRAWVTYRYGTVPEVRYRLLLARRQRQPVGYLSYSLRVHNGRRSGLIADLFTAPEDLPTRVALLRFAVKDLLAYGAEDVRALCTTDPAILTPFKRTGFRVTSAGFDVSIVPLTDHLHLEALQDAQRWFSMGGDFDVV